MNRIAVFFCLLLASVQAHATIFYVDPSSTASTASGTLAAPWKTLDQVNSNMSLFNPGDQILFRRGQKFSGTLTVNRSGTAGNPITFGAYGTGADPLFWGTGSTINMLFYTYNRSYITFYGLNVSDTTISPTDRSVQSKIQRAFYIDGTSNNVIIRKCKIDRVGVGLFLVGPNNIMDSCDIGNMRLVKNTPTSVNANDDYGANPVVLSGSNNKITNNFFHDCWANSYDYLYDGGGIEMYGAGVSNNFIGYNTFYDCNGILECGSGNGGIMENNVFAYNKFINNGNLFWISSGGSFVVSVRNLQFYNNVVVETIASRLGETALGALSNSTTDSTIVVYKNNVFWLTNGVDVARSGQLAAYQFIHENNVYRLGTNSVLNFTAHSSELVSTTATVFTNTTPSDAIAWNYRLATGSPAVNFGSNVGLTKDFEGVTVPSIPHAGIFQNLSSSINPIIVTATTTSGINCNGGNATVEITATGGLPPYRGTGTYNIPAGLYNVLVTDSLGNRSLAHVNNSQPAALTSTLSAGTITTSGGTTSLTVTASGGTASYTYNLNGGAFQTSNVFSGLSAGTYTVQVKDSKGCLASNSVTITAASTLSAAATAGTAIACYGGTTTVTVSGSGGVAPYTGTGTFTVGAGTYSYTVTDAAGASTTTSVTVTQPTQLNATLSSGTINSSGGTTTVTVTATGGTAAYTYSLNGGTYQTSNVFSSVGVGTHTITVKDSKGCTTSKTITLALTASSPLTISATSGTAIACNGGTTTVTISASGGVTPYTGTGTFTVSAGTYSYTVTDAINATVSTSVTVSQPTALAATLSAGTINTVGGTTSITVTASGGTAAYTYSLNGGTYQTSNVFSTVAAGTHSISVKDSKGCMVTKTITLAVTASSPLTANTTTGTAIACNGGTTTITVSASGGFSPYTGTGTFTVAAGTYTYTVTDAVGASATKTVTVSQPTALAATLSAGTINTLAGTTSITVTASGGTTAYSYNLNGGAYQTSNIFSGVSAGTHTINIKDAKGCIISKTITLAVTPASPLTASAAISAAIACNGGSATISVTASGGISPYTGTGTYTVTAGTYSYTVRDAINGSSTVSVTVTQPTALSATTSNGVITTIGGTTSLSVTASGGTPVYTYSLNNGAYQTSNTFSSVGAGTHTVRVKDSKGCILTKSVTINVTPVTPLSISVVAGTVACKGSPTTVTVSASGGLPPYSGTGTFTTIAGTYTYGVSDALGATDSETITISQPQAIVLTLTPGTITVNGGTTSITATASGGTGSYQYKLGTGAFQTSNVFSGLAAGTYSISVKDSNDCSRTSTVTLTEPPKPFSISLVSKSNITCKGRTDGKIIVTGNNGYTPYRFRIGNGFYGTSTTFSNLAPGNYVITGRDSIGTTSSITVTILSTNVNCNSLRMEGKSNENLLIETVTSDIHIYPNPSQSYFRIQLPTHVRSQIKLVITDMNGRMLDQVVTRQPGEIQIGENYAQGIYQLRVFTDDRVQSFKLIKTR